MKITHIMNDHGDVLYVTDDGDRFPFYDLTSRMAAVLQSHSYDPMTLERTGTCQQHGQVVLVDLSDGDVSGGDADVESGSPEGEPWQDADGGDVDQGDGDGQGGDGDSQGEPESGDAQGDGEQGQPIPFPDFPAENAPIDESALVDEIWQVIRPRVVEIAENRAGFAARFMVDVHESLMAHGGDAPDVPVPGRPRKSGRKPRKGNGAQVKHHMYDKVLAAVGAGVNVYLPGEPGTGKSHMCAQIAEDLGIPFGVSSFSPMSTESKLIGFRDANGNTVRTVYRDIYENGGIWLGDELDNANPAIVAGLNSGLANGFMEFPDGVVKRHETFRALATANTFGTGPTAEFSGRQKLDPATLNRFVKIYIGTDEVMEQVLVEQILDSVNADRLLGKIRHYRKAVADLRIKTFVTMRDSLNSARLIADGGFTVVEALEMTCLGILTPDQREKINGWRG